MIGLAAEAPQDSREADLAVWRRVAQCLGVLDALVPDVPVSRPPELYQVGLQDILEDIQRYRQGSEPTPRLKALAHWRYHVTHTEARNAGKLETLLHATIELNELRCRHDSPRLEHAAEQLAAHFASRWRLDPRLDRKNSRLWCVRTTRRYDVLPREWREI